MLHQKSSVRRTTTPWFLLQHHLTFILCISALEVLVALPLRGQATATAGWPISVRFSGKMFLAPTGEKGRHNDLLPLSIGPEHIVYLQVEKFHTASKTRSELMVFADMQKHKPAVRVINSDALIPLLNEETFRGKKVAINGFFYQTAGLLWIAEAHVEGE